MWAHIKQHVIDVAVGGLLSTPFDLLDELLAQAYVDEKEEWTGGVGSIRESWRRI